MDDLSNRDLSQVPAEELTPAERAELKRRLDSFVEALRKRLIDGRTGSGPKALASQDPADQGSED